MSRFRTVLDDYPDSVGQDKVLFHLGMALIKTNQPGEAQEAFDRLRAEHPESSWVAKVPQQSQPPSEAETEQASAEPEDEETA